MDPKVTFVTAFLNIYETPFLNKDIEWRFRYFKKIAETGIPISAFISPDCRTVMEEMIHEYPNIKVVEYIDLKDTWTYKVCTSVENLELPNTRNKAKDTKEYIILMNTKTEFLKKAIDANLWQTHHYAWIDFNLFHVLKDKVAEEAYAKEILMLLNKRPLRPTIYTMPGCWDKQHVIDEYLINDVCWRWCGGFFIGDKKSILDFHRLHELHLAEFLEKTKKLVWEVNFWAWLEKTYDSCILQYKADHNISILEIGGEVTSYQVPIERSHRYEFPILRDENAVCKEFRPTSMSYVYYKGDHLLNIRYINYWLYPGGGYLIHHPERHIYTKNFFSIWKPLMNIDPVGLYEMDESSITLKNYGGSIYGLEDIRLYEYNDELYFIATNINHSPVGRNRMIRGKYNIEKRIYEDSVVLTPPKIDSWCEKNWIPIIKGGKEYFIYKWFPFEIGTLVEKKDDLGVSYTQLDICLQYQHRTPFFERVRGSTTFIPVINGNNAGNNAGNDAGNNAGNNSGNDAGNNSGYLGVVHFSEERSPRQYFHMLVLLDKETLMPLKYSSHFFFHRASIEFCIGFSIIDDSYHFWISNFDRDPELVIIKKESIPLNFEFFYI